MLTDKGFSHAIAKAILEDNPHDESALRILAVQPENFMVLDDGSVINLSKVSEDEARKKGRKQQLSRLGL